MVETSVVLCLVRGRELNGRVGVVTIVFMVDVLVVLIALGKCLHSCSVNVCCVDVCIVCSVNLLC